MVEGKRKVILDVDTGTDDATAIILAALAPKIELLGITTVWGNLPLSVTTEQTLMITELMKKDIPVYVGCPGPIARGLYPQAHKEHRRVAVDAKGKEYGYHDLFQLPRPLAQAQRQHGVDYIVETCRTSREKITLVAAGPLTNIGMALRIAPDIVKNIREVVVMGGGITQSNSTLCAEGNIFRDPEAAEILLKSGAPATFITLDATHRAALPVEYVDRCRGLGNPVGDFFAEILRQRIRVYNALQPLWRGDIAPIHDALCVAYLLDPAVIPDMRRVHLNVCLDHGNGAGAFLIDTRYYHLKENANVAYDGSWERFGEVVMDTLEKAEGLFWKGEEK